MDTRDLCICLSRFSSLHTPAVRRAACLQVLGALPGAACVLTRLPCGRPETFLEYSGPSVKPRTNGSSQSRQSLLRRFDPLPLTEQYPRRQHANGSSQEN